MAIILNPAEQALDTDTPETSTPRKAAVALIIHAAETFSQYLDCPDIVDQGRIFDNEKLDVSGEAFAILDQLRSNLS
jgi:hypothetical protein